MGSLRQADGAAAFILTIFSKDKTRPNRGIKSIAMGKLRLVSQKSESVLTQSGSYRLQGKLSLKISVPFGWNPLGYKNTFPLSAVPQRNPIF